MLDGARTRHDPSVVDDEPTPGVVRCGVCDREIARLAERIMVGSGELHTFVNPSGEVFELACFSQADGAVAAGPSSLELTWYAGHAWRCAGCRSCGVQLGWCFEGPTRFWGLSRRALRWP